MRIIGAKTGILFCSMAIASYGCAMIAGLDENVYNQDPPSGTAGTSGGGGGSIGSGGGGSGGSGSSPVIWGIELESSVDVVVVHSAVVNPSTGDIWITGSFRGSLSFPQGTIGPLMGDASGLLDTIFWARIDKNGQLMAANQLPFTGKKSAGYDITLNDANEAVIVGAFEGVYSIPIANKSDGPYTISSVGNNDIIALIANNEAVVKNVFTFSGMGDAQPNAVAVAKQSGSIFIAGNFDGEFNYPGTGPLIPAGTAKRDGFLLSFSVTPQAATGEKNFLWIKQLSSQGMDAENSINDVEVQPNGDNLAIACTCTKGPTFDLTPPPLTITTEGKRPCAALITQAGSVVTIDGEKAFAVGNYSVDGKQSGEGLAAAFAADNLGDTLAVAGTYTYELSLDAIQTSPDTTGSENGFMARLPIVPAMGSFFHQPIHLISLFDSPSKVTTENIVSTFSANELQFIGGHIQSPSTIKVSNSMNSTAENTLDCTNAMYVASLDFQIAAQPKIQRLFLQSSQTNNRLHHITWSPDESVVAVGDFKGDLRASSQCSQSSSTPIFNSNDNLRAFVIKLKL